MDTEGRKTFQEIDSLASAYGWSIEYISKLDQYEINQLLLAISEREMENYKMLSYITALGINGKTLDDLGKGINITEVKESNKEVIEKKQKMQEQNMVKLFQLLGTKSKKIIEGIQKKKLEA